MWNDGERSFHVHFIKVKILSRPAASRPPFDELRAGSLQKKQRRGSLSYDCSDKGGSAPAWSLGGGRQCPTIATRLN